MVKQHKSSDNFTFEKDKTANTSCTAMNGPYPPVVPPKPPNIEVSNTIDVTSTAGPQQQQQKQKQQKQSQHQEQQQSPAHSTPHPERISIEPSKYNQHETTQLAKRSNEPSKQRNRNKNRTSVFAESLEQPSTTASNKLKLEPRVEPPGSAYRGRRAGQQVNPEIGIISFLCEYPRARAQSVEPKKNLFQTLLQRSSSERRLLSGSKQKMAAAVATKRTSDGRGYSQIVIGDLYEGGANKSTYQVNNVEGFGEPLMKKRRSRGKRLGEEMVKSVKKREPIESVSGDGESAVVTSDQMADSIHTNLNGGKKEDADSNREQEIEMRKRERSPAPILPLQKAAESTFGVDFTSILRRHEEATASPKKVKRGSFNTSMMARSESRPNVRDFAGDGSSSFIRSAFRRRSKSPVKKTPAKESLVMQRPMKQSPVKSRKEGSKQKDIEEELPRAPPTSPEVPDLSVYTRRINSIRDSVAQHAGLGALVPLVEPASNDQRQSVISDSQRQSAVSQSQQSSGHSSEARNSSTSNGHSKSPSGISAASMENDNLSEVSSAIISDAQSISIHKPNGNADWSTGAVARKSLRPGPAPTGPLPSLPEGADVQLPSTPRRSESSQRRSSPERSPAKSRPKTPARYRLTPADESPTKRPPSPERTNAATKPEQITRKPAALVRIHTANLNAFPSPPLPSPERAQRQQIATVRSEKLLNSMSESTLGARAERTRRLKAKDLARERSQTATFFDEAPPPMPTTRTTLKMTNGGDGHKDSIERLIDSYDTQQISNPWHRPRTSLVSTFSASTQDNRNSMRSSEPTELSPIIIVADQEPVTPPKPLYVKSPSSEHNSGFGNPSTGTEIHCAPFPSPNHGPERPKSCTDSAYSIQLPQPPHKSPGRSIANKSPHRSVAGRAPTPFTHPALRRTGSHRSSQRSSFAEPDLEARMAAMEKKNLLLERAFLAVMDASASISSGDGSQARDSGHSFETGDRFSGGTNGGYDHHDRSSGGVSVRDENGDRLYAGLEKLLIRQGSGRLSALSTCSGPF